MQVGTSSGHPILSGIAVPLRPSEKRKTDHSGQLRIRPAWFEDRHDLPAGQDDRSNQGTMLCRVPELYIGRGAARSRCEGRVKYYVSTLLRNKPDW